MTTKKKILQIAADLGFQRTVIAGLQPMESKRYLNWIDKGFAGEMNYLKRDPVGRNNPSSLVPGARAAIVSSVSYYTEQPPSPGLYYGKVARYAVGSDYHIVLKKKFVEMKERIEEALGKPILAKAFTDDVGLHERALASRHGLGFAGKHSLVIGTAMNGTYNFIGELFTDLEIEPDEPYQGTCGNCFRCGTACPTDAIDPPYQINSNLCISYLTIENKGEIPVMLRHKLGTWVYGCDICQEVCPYNQRPPETPWLEFRPENGVGHDLNLLDLLKIQTNAEFKSRFANTALLRPKRKGLLRNALVVTGNVLGTAGDSKGSGTDPEFVLQQVFEFAKAEAEPLLREHAVWALTQNKSPLARRFIEALVRCEPETNLKELFRQHLETAQVS
jgi:epoxyqueuosine reductase